MKLSMMAALLLNPAADPFASGGGGGGGPAPSPTPAPAAAAPAPSPTPSPTPAPAADPNRGSIANLATNSGERNFDLADSATGSPAPTSATPAPAPADPNQAAGATTGTPSNFQSIRDAARQLNYQFGDDIADDYSALAHLVQRAQANQEADYYAQLGRTIAPHAPAIREFMDKRNQPPAPAERQPWEAPEFDPKWEHLVTRDQQSGMFLSRPGVDPAIGRKVNDYVAWKQEYDSNPTAMINKMLEARETKARETALEVYREQAAVAQREQTAQEIVRQNSAWFNAKDANGRDIIDQRTGRAVPSPNGVIYLRHLQTVVNQYGVTDPAQQNKLAMQLMAGEIAVANMQNRTVVPPSADPTQVAANAATAATNTNPLATLTGAARENHPQTPPAPHMAHLSLVERMQKLFKEEGINDDTFSLDSIG